MGGRKKKGARREMRVNAEVYLFLLTSRQRGSGFIQPIVGAPRHAAKTQSSDAMNARSCITAGFTNRGNGDDEGRKGPEGHSLSPPLMDEIYRLFSLEGPLF